MSAYNRGTMAIDPALLSQFKLYRGLSQESLAALASIAVLKTVRKGQRLWRQGEMAEGYYSSVTGLVKSYREAADGREQLLCLLGPGQQIGAMSVLSESPYPCNCSVLETGEMIYFPKSGFKEAVRQHHDLALHLLAGLASQCNVLADRIEDLSLRDAEGRLANYLLELPVKGTSPAGHSIVRLPVSKTTLATMMGVSRETLSRTFATLQHRGMIEIDGREIGFVDLDQLEALTSRGAETMFVH